MLHPHNNNGSPFTNSFNTALTNTHNTTIKTYQKDTSDFASLNKTPLSLNTPAFSLQITTNTPPPYTTPVHNTTAPEHNHDTSKTDGIITNDPHGKIEGGDWSGDNCINNHELDEIFRQIIPSGNYTRANEFFLWRTGATTKLAFEDSISKRKGQEKNIFITLHIRNHWLLAVLEEKDEFNSEKLVTIYDSAPSKAATQDLSW